MRGSKTAGRVQAIDGKYQGNSNQNFNSSASGTQN